MYDRPNAEAVSIDVVSIEDASAEFLGRWNVLVSTTNWEKGKIIYDWREALIVTGAPSAEYSDEAWSRRVGNVSGQHSGRLRRVYERFGAVSETYPGLYWSHFQAALDWDDAEMWLEGGLQNQWSIAEMRRQRCEALGLVESPSEVAPAEEFDDGAEVDAADRPLTGEVAAVRDPSGSDWDGEGSQGPNFDDSDRDDGISGEYANDDGTTATNYADSVNHAVDNEQSRETEEAPFRPFAQLSDLPPDLSDAFESFKLAILRQRLDGWREISQHDAIASLEALKLLILAPAEQ